MSNIILALSFSLCSQNASASEKKLMRLVESVEVVVDLGVRPLLDNSCASDFTEIINTLNELHADSQELAIEWLEDRSDGKASYDFPCAFRISVILREIVGYVGELSLCHEDECPRETKNRTIRHMRLILGEFPNIIMKCKDA
jgi:hypothetical protein